MAFRRWPTLLLALALACVSAPAPVHRDPPPSAPAPAPSVAPEPAAHTVALRADLDRLFRYVQRGWSLLERGNEDLLGAARDPKFPSPGGKWPVYVPAAESPERILDTLRTKLSDADLSKLIIRRLPAKQQLPIAEPAEPGILYLPHPYVVPGGRFNEMYGWDSYFIVRGLLRDGRVELARAMVDNFLYEVEHYGMILNANRSYYLSRSQPPFLTPMILAVYGKTLDKAWLRATLPATEQYYEYWTQGLHATAETGLSRYHDLGRGPAPEVVQGEKDEQGRSHYDRVQAWFRVNTTSDYDAARFYDKERDALTELFYVADRSMRESGFDPSNRFGPFNLGVIDHVPVCLNSLLYRMEQDAATVHRLLGDAPGEARWAARARARAEAINQYLWDPELELYLDYDFVRKRRRNYPFGATFFALWVGVASRDQAVRLAARALELLEAPGGLRTSTTPTGNQWDAPFGWAPLELIAVEGLRNYGLVSEADRISVKFLSLVLKEFIEHRAVFEKYDVETCESDVGAQVRFGYTSNEIGFGWTNAAFTVLYDALPGPAREKVLQGCRATE